MNSIEADFREIKLSLWRIEPVLSNTKTISDPCDVKGEVLPVFPTKRQGRRAALD